SLVPTVFTLTDQLLADAGVTGTFTWDAATPQPAADTPIQPGAANKLTYTIHASFTVDPAAPGFQYECGSESNPTGGLANQAS
ncbi:MAG TPA: hypothetical protein PLV68_06295, partial [Ilumatobacteraceae bacterium]|nr:hypothetical protein [Ilumatobacteraceae bacterium]